jgi:hypothetical protein
MDGRVMEFHGTKIHPLPLSLRFPAGGCRRDVSSQPAAYSLDFLALLESDRTACHDFTIGSKFRQMQANICKRDTHGYSDLLVESITVFFQVFQNFFHDSVPEVWEMVCSIYLHHCRSEQSDFPFKYAYL